MSFSLQVLSPSLAPVDQKMLLASIQRHLERNERARLRMARVRSSSFVRLKSKNEQPSAHESIEPGIGRGIIKPSLKGESERRRKIYIQRYGEEAYKEYVERRERRRREGDGREALEH
ncbi:hypothetical protein MVEN_00122000 [Mycena venus]|uniref:Uncharacterized protein n=1 Tax=Mycena venus TaxID=2733690 RepID=A0A8H6Z892_9AGAR|nr:hypothetical protein MVEN_00122000 [Mycena venus]